MTNLTSMSLAAWPALSQHGVRYSSRVKFTKPKVKPRDYVYVSRGASVARPSNRKLGHLPGYSGTIPHLDQVLGRSFGAVSLSCRLVSLVLRLP